MLNKEIKDTPISNVATLVLWDNETLQEIKEKSGPLANTCEYQVHYWSLNLKKVFEDGSILYIQIPTTIFNYKQEVAGASIDFELTDVEQISNELAPIQEIEVQKLLQALPKDLKQSFEIESVSLNTLHRHP